MITVWGEGRGLRVVWLLEEMGLPYRLRPVDMLNGAENDAGFMAINPAGFIPALQDGETILVESVAIMAYLLARHGQASAAAATLTPAADDPGFGLYQQFLHMGEAGLMMPAYIHFITKFLAPEDQRANWTEAEAAAIFANRLTLVTRQLQRAPYMAGDRFTAADISVSYALIFAHLIAKLPLGEAERAYLDRTTARDAYRRTLATCTESTGWPPV